MANWNMDSYPELKILIIRNRISCKGLAKAMDRSVSYLESRLNAEKSLRFDLKDVFRIQDIFKLDDQEVLYLLSEEQRDGGTCERQLRIL